MRTWGDYNYDCSSVSRLVRAIGTETNVPGEAFDRLEGFVESLPQRGFRG